jgi:Tol biopolymer transport system component
MEPQQLRELRPALGYFAFLQWSPNGRELLTVGRDMKGRNNGLYRIDVQTGNATLIASPFQGNSPQWAADGTRVYFRRGSAVIERDLASGHERDVVQIPNTGVGGLAVSPDRRFVAYQAGEASGRQDLLVMPMAGGVPRSVLQVSAPERLVNRFGWTSDGRALVAAKQVDRTGRRELWMADASGGQPRKLDIDVANWSIEDGFDVDRAGRQVAFVAAAGQPGLEIRALENFLPTPTAAGSGAKR